MFKRYKEEINNLIRQNDSLSREISYLRKKLKFLENHSKYYQIIYEFKQDMSYVINAGSVDNIKVGDKFKVVDDIETIIDEQNNISNDIVLARYILVVESVNKYCCICKVDTLNGAPLPLIGTGNYVLPLKYHRYMSL